MSRRRATSQSGLSEAEELQAWDSLFRFGQDYFSALAVLGCPSWHADRAGFHRWIEREAPIAWKRLGSAFMFSWRPDSGHPRPWAEEHLIR